jgi:hypothetical protein
MSRSRKNLYVMEIIRPHNYGMSVAKRGNAIAKAFGCAQAIAATAEKIESV